MILLLLKFTQNISARIIGNGRHYLQAPDEVISWIKLERLYRWGHLLPSVVITILIVTRLLPALSDSYAQQLEKNGTLIPITAILLVLPILVFNGIILEKYLMNKNREYKSFVTKQ